MICRICRRELDFYTSNGLNEPPVKTLALHEGDEAPAGFVKIDRFVSVSYKRRLRQKLEATCDEAREMLEGETREE